MKFNYIITNTTEEANKQVLEQLKKNDSEYKGRHVLIVTNRGRLNAEIDLYQKAFPNGSFNVDVYSFGRLVKKVLKKQNVETFSREGSIMYMNKIILKCNFDNNLLFYKDIKSISFARKMLDTITTLRNNHVLPEDIAGYKKNESESYKLTTYEKKLSDIYTIYNEYIKDIEGTLFDTVSGIEKLIHNINLIPDVKNTDFYIYGLNVFNVEERLLIQELIKNSRSVTIAFLEKDFGARNGFIYSTEQLNRFISFCNENHIETNKIEAYEKLPEDIEYLHRQMFGFKNVPKDFNEKNISICECDNAYDEIKAVASEIQYLVFNKGFRYKDISIVSNNPSYQKVIDTIFNRSNIPHFTDTRVFIKNTIFARFVIQTLKVLKSNFKAEDVFEYIRHPFSCISNEDAQFFENYCLKYNTTVISKNDRKIDTSNIKKEYEIESIKKEVARFNKVKNEIYESLNYLLKLKDDSRTAHNISNYFLGLAKSSEDLTNLVMEEKCFITIDEYFKKKEAIIESDITQKLYHNLSKMIIVMKELSKVYDDKNIGFDGYYNILTSTIENLTASIIPQYIDNVYVGSTSASVFGKCKALFIVGANEGYFPPRVEDNLILTQKDMEQLQGYKESITLYPTPKEKEIEEKFNILDILTKGEHVYISYAKLGLNSEMLERSTGVNDILTILNFTEIKPDDWKDKLVIKEEYKSGYILKRDSDFGEFYKYYGIIHNDELTDIKSKIIYYYICPENLYYELMNAKIPLEYVSWVKDYLSKKGYNLNIAKPVVEKFNINDYHDIKDDKKLLSVSKIESFYSCPYRFFIQYILDLKEREIGKISTLDTGNYIHEICEVYFKKIMKKYNNFDGVKLAKIEDIELLINESIDECKKEILSNPKNNIPMIVNQINEISKIAIDKLKELTEMLKESKFFPKAIERSFGIEDDISFEYDGEKYVFKGKIDRVDEYITDTNEKQITVLDYKSKDIKDSGLEYVYTGRKIQLYLYALYYLKNGYEPVGFFYIPLTINKKKQEKIKYCGQVINDSDTMNDISEKWIGKYNKEDHYMNRIEGVRLDDFSKNKNCLDKKEIEAVCDYVMEMSRLAIDKLSNGYMDKTPYKDCPEYCPMYGKCENTHPRKEIGSKSMVNIKFRDIMSKLNEDKGDSDGE